MVFFLAGVALLLLILVGKRYIVSTDPRKLAAALRKLGGVTAIAVAALLLIRGIIGLAIPLALFGLSLFKTSGFRFTAPFGTAQKSPGQRSHVRTNALEMELDHDSGEMVGTSLKGKFVGRTLSSLSEPELAELFAELQDGDPQDLALMQAYLDWRVPHWREQAKEEGGMRSRTRPSANRMDAGEAYAVLGLARGATEAEIRRAHRQLMKKVHPDQGGSTYLATRINEAKEVLLGRK